MTLLFRALLRIRGDVLFDVVGGRLTAAHQYECGSTRDGEPRHPNERARAGKIGRGTGRGKVHGWFVL